MEPSERSPSLNEVVDQLKFILQNRATREAVSNWAETWVMTDDANVENSAVWHLLTLAASVDLRVSSSQYLYSESDIEGWIQPFIDQPFDLRTAS